MWMKIVKNLIAYSMLYKRINTLENILIKTLQLSKVLVIQSVETFCIYYLPYSKLSLKYVF